MGNTGTLKRKNEESTTDDILPEESMKRVHREREQELKLPPGFDSSSVLSYFMLFLTDESIETIVKATNAHADKDLQSDSSLHKRKWDPTSSAEMKVFFAILVYMSVHDSKETSAYWNMDIESGPVHTTAFYMTQKRFEQLKRYLHLSDPNRSEGTWFDKLEPLLAIVRLAGEDVRGPGSCILDEKMIRSLKSDDDIHETWFTILLWIIDNAIANAYKVYRTYHSELASSRLLYRPEFRKRLYKELFTFDPRLPHQRLNRHINHTSGRIGNGKRRVCVWCKFKRTIKGDHSGGLPNSTRVCETCDNVALCLKGPCWEEFHRS